MLPDAGETISAADLTQVFQRFATKRQPRTAQLVKGARAQGELRVTSGEQACKERNEKVKKMWENQTAAWTAMDAVYREPF